MQSNGIELIVRVKERAIKEYNHNNQVFIEGRAGSNYEIEVINRTVLRVEAVISVDGLSVIDGKPAGGHSTGYLIEGLNSVRVPGWMVDQSSVAKFAFTGKAGSYAAQMNDGKSPNNGVIGVLVYNARPPSVYTTPPNWLYNGRPTWSWDWDDLRSRTRSAPTIGAAGALTGNMFNVTAQNAITSNVPSSTASPESQMFQSTLGTGFGDASAFNTRSVTFDRGTVLTTMSMYYDTLKNLRALGVPVKERRTPRVNRNQRPNAFPGLGCEPPHGWKG